MQKRTWREKFPLGRVFIALFAVPFPAIVVMLLFGEITGTGAPEERFSLKTTLLFLPTTAAIFAWPGYVVFLLLGVPTLYLLFRLRRSDVFLFLLFGGIYAPLPWFLAALRGPFSADTYYETLKAEVPIFVLFGIAAGWLTRIIVIPSRRTPVDCEN